MYNFTTETQGLDTFLVHEISEETQLDTAGLGMLLNNRVSGLCPVSSIEIDNRKTIRYQVSSQIPLQQFFMDKVDKKRFLTVLNNILTAIDNMEDFMLDPGMLLLDRQYIFVNVGTLQTNLIYYPVLSDRHEFRLDNFIKSMIMNTEFDPNEQDNYVTMLISYLNCGEKLTIAEIKQYISLLLSSTNHKPQQQTTAAYASQQPYMNGAVQQPAMNMGTQPYMTQTPQQSGSMQQPMSAPMASAPVNGGFAVPNAAMASQQPAAPQQPAKKKSLLEMLGLSSSKSKKDKPKKEKASKADKKSKKDIVTPSGMVIPNMDNTKSSTLPQPPRPAGAPSLPQQNQVLQQPANNVVPPVTQQPVITNIPPVQPSKPPIITNIPPMPSQPVINNVPQQPVITNITPMQQQPVNNHAPQQPLQFEQDYTSTANFGETVVLGTDTAGETTVLNAGYNTVQKQMNPYLIRKKTGERVEINKNVFRIGKEKNYVDYCISDNSAVSRSHADIIKKDNEFYIVDNNSLNHTFLNSKQIPSSQMQKLSDYMIIQLADEIFEFRL